MRFSKLFLTMFFFGLCAASAAQAQTSRLYFAGYLGLPKFQNMEFSEDTVPLSGEIQSDRGNSFAGALGIRLSRQVRAEAEIAYSTVNMDGLDLNTGARSGLGGEWKIWTGMLNVYYDFDLKWDKLQPFIGAGLGYGYYNGKIDDGSGPALDINRDANTLTWQVGGGLKYRIEPDLAFTGSYRYLDSLDLSLGSYEIDYGSHEFRLGLEYDLPVRGD